MKTNPQEQGFYFPAEWEKHEATWLSWPHKNESWPGKIESIYQHYCAFIKIVVEDELVRINVTGAEMEAFALFYTAKVLNKKASCLMSVVDSKYIKEVATPEERQTGLNNMIKLALESAVSYI